MCESDTKDRIIIPPANAVKIIQNTNRLFLRECQCRAINTHCPPSVWDVCLLTENASSEDLENAKPISKKGALSIIKTAIEQGLIFNLFYTPGDLKETEICSCCTVCCRPLQKMKREGNYKDQLRSGYVAITDLELCISCGECEEACFFRARQIVGGKMEFVYDHCFGCGRCIKHCKQKAISLKFNQKFKQDCSIVRMEGQTSRC